MKPTLIGGFEESAGVARSGTSPRSQGDPANLETTDPSPALGSGAPLPRVVGTAVVEAASGVSASLQAATAVMLSAAVNAASVLRPVFMVVSPDSNPGAW